MLTTLQYPEKKGPCRLPLWRGIHVRAKAMNLLAIYVMHCARHAAGLIAFCLLVISAKATSSTATVCLLLKLGKQQRGQLSQYRSKDVFPNGEGCEHCRSIIETRKVEKGREVNVLANSRKFAFRLFCLPGQLAPVRICLGIRVVASSPRFVSYHHPGC